MFFSRRLARLGDTRALRAGAFICFTATLSSHSDNSRDSWSDESLSASRSSTEHLCAEDEAQQGWAVSFLSLRQHLLGILLSDTFPGVAPSRCCSAWIDRLPDKLSCSDSDKERRCPHCSIRNCYWCTIKRSGTVFLFAVAFGAFRLVKTESEGASSCGLVVLNPGPLALGPGLASLVVFYILAGVRAFSVWCHCIHPTSGVLVRCVHCFKSRHSRRLRTDFMEPAVRRNRWRHQCVLCLQSWRAASSR